LWEHFAVSIKRSSLPEISAHTKATWTRTRHDRSAGGVAYRRVVAEENAPAHLDAEPIQMEDFEVALIATRGGRRWQLPKGSREGNESSLETAIREVHEEVGLHTESQGFLQTIDYWYWDTYRKDVPELVHKAVDFYLLRVVGGVLSDSSYEVDAVGWFRLDHALRVLTFPGEREVLEMAQSKLQADANARDKGDPL
jgi:8-oxo-dGTP pyrophosphatase MutT (NUDIX family)